MNIIEPKDAIDVMDEMLTAIEEAQGIRSRRDGTNRYISYHPKNNAKLLEVYKDPAGKDFIDEFISHTPNPKGTREQFGI
jgi:hypothetical protein